MSEHKTGLDVVIKATELFSDAEPDKVFLVWASGREVYYESNCRPYEAFGLIETAKQYIMGNTNSE